ncbi:MAG: hypothetical protein RMJ28_02740 [Nitrososphaerota archaeon]|nr:hypothetical protein [Nitrososphaerota archaeon]
MRDRDFAGEFAKCLEAVLSRAPPRVRGQHSQRSHSPGTYYTVRVKDATLYELLRGRGIEKVRRLV